MVILFSVFVIALLLLVPAAAFAEGETGDDSEVGTSSATSDDGGNASSGTDEPANNNSSTDTGTDQSGDDSTSSETDGSDTGASDNSSADEGDEQNADTSSDSDSGDAPDPDSTSTAGSEPEETQTGDDEGSPDSETNSDDPADDQLASDGETDDSGSGDPEPNSTLTASVQEPEDGYEVDEGCCDEEGEDDSASGDCYTAEIDNTIVEPDTTATFTITFTETSSDTDLGSAQVTIPDGFTSISFDPSDDITTSDGQNWSGSLDGQVISLWADSSGYYLGENESVSATFSATTPSEQGFYEFETKAWTEANSSFNGVADDPAKVNDMAGGYDDPQVTVGPLVEPTYMEPGQNAPLGPDPTVESLDSPDDCDLQAVKINAPGNGDLSDQTGDIDKTNDESDFDVTINLIDGTNNEETNTFAFDSNMPVMYVWVKAGNGGNLYSYYDTYPR
ncbi:MAG: hypothetical protein AVO34_07265 [Firmicutes bacterium ML8_F2]|jgi:hypothetical protein|nr:MAG: hypothetical protein AVO34_07265 [Firmicutes bacterium ML8_F2]